MIDQFGTFSAIDDVVFGAMKFELLKYDTYQDVVFDINAALDQKGFSGPYVQYANARAQSVLSKSDKDRSTASVESVFSTVDINDFEFDILKLLFKFEDAVLRSAEDLAPHHLCKYLFDLSKAFNAFYNSSKVIGSSQENFRVELTFSVVSVLSKSMYLLGIGSPKSLK